jgi:hypothetical protein
MLFNNLLQLVLFVKIISASDDNIFKLTVRRTNIGRVKYRDGEVVLSQNQQKLTDIFFTPFPYFLPKDTECQKNELTGHTSLILVVQLYTDELIDIVNTYLNQFHPILCNMNNTHDGSVSSRCHVSLLPMNEIRAVQRDQISTDTRLKYTLDNKWKPNNMLLKNGRFCVEYSQYECVRENTHNLNIRMSFI